MPPDGRAITSGASEPSVTSPLQQVAATALNAGKESFRVFTAKMPNLKVSAAFLGQRAYREAEKRQR